MQTINWRVPYWRTGVTGLVLVGLALLHSVWQLNPHGDQSAATPIAALPEPFTMSIERSASGNIFTVGRSRSEPDAKPEEAESQPVVSELQVTYQLVSIVRQGPSSHAVFVAGDQRVILAIGDSHPQLGQLHSIDGRQVTLIDNDGAAHQWQLFNSQPLEQPTSDTQE